MLASLLLPIFGARGQGNAKGPISHPSRDRSADSLARHGRPSPAQLRALGQQMVQREIATYGQAQNVQWDHDVGMLLDRLTRAAELPTQAVQLVIVNDSEFNAQALPGGFLVVNAGLLLTTDRLAALGAATDSIQRERYLGYTAAVLGHELAHQTLGHTADIEAMFPHVPGRKRTDDTFEMRLERAMANPAVLRRQAKSRAQESAADRTGALYMLRAGFEIQRAMDLFRALDSLERVTFDASTIVDSVRSLSWLSDHPRASQREAELERFRGTLKLDQGRFDDALILVRTNLQLDTAVTLLDSVLAHFPELGEAQHLRAAALHRLYLRHVPAERQQIRSAVPTYTARFVSSIRGENGLEQARSAYREILRHEILPYSLSNLAVLDAYAGQLGLAVARADSAVRLDSANAEVRLNLGAVLFLAGRYRDALAAFQLAALRSSGDMPAVRFDIARTLLAAGDSGRGRDLLNKYASSDVESEWGKFALRLAGTGANVALASGATRFNVAAVVSLGAGDGDVKQRLGEPDHIDTSEGREVWRYDARGLRLCFNSQMRVAIVSLSRADAGAVDGVRTGDPANRAEQVWGAPDEVERGVAYYERSEMVVAVEARDGVIRTLTIGALH